MNISLVITTLNRELQLNDLLLSLQRQSYQNFDVIIVDQNNDNVLSQIDFRKKYNLNVRVFAVSRRSASSARNFGAEYAAGEYISFPDDDCWYKDSLLQEVFDTISSTGASVITGRSIDPILNNSDGKFLQTSKIISKKEIPLAGIEYSIFMKRNIFEQINGFDENISVGSEGKYQSGEASDLLYRLHDDGHQIYFNSDLVLFHPLKQVYSFKDSINKKNLRKEFGYSAGFGYVLKKNKQEFVFFNYLVRSMGKVLIATVTLKFNLLTPALFSMYGRLYGFLSFRNAKKRK